MPVRWCSILFDACWSNPRINKPSVFYVFRCFQWFSMLYNVSRWCACLSNVFLYLSMLVGATLGLINIPFSMFLCFAMIWNTCKAFQCLSTIWMPFQCFSILSDGCWSNPRFNKPSFFSVFSHSVARRYNHNAKNLTRFSGFLWK